MLRLRLSPSGVVRDHRPHQPPSCGEGIVYQVHISAPVATLYARTNPRMPYSAPEVPMMTLSSITSGAMVWVYPSAGSPVCAAHFSLPVASSSATSCPSRVPPNTEPPAIATPRLLGPQQAVETPAFLCV